VDKETIEEKISCDMFWQQCVDQEREESKTIKRSECPYGGIDCAWCLEDCEQ